MDAIINASGERAMADQDVCIAVGEDLTQAYPGYAWSVGCNHDAGVIHIELAVPVAIGGMARPGFMMHLSSVLGPSGQRKVRAAGGEVLERWNLRRGAAKSDWFKEAQENGLDRSNMVEKSVDSRWT